MSGVESAPESTILDEVKKLIYGDRRRDYDHPLDNFRRIAQIWTILTQEKYKFTEEEVALFMIAVKLSREAYTPKRDNIVDIIGYAGCHDESLREKRRRLLEVVESKHGD